jgi:rhodanese-related sulfurtransferase
MDIREVSPAEAHDILGRDPDAVYLDVRTEGEFEGGHPAGARNVPVVLVDPATRQPVPNPGFLPTVEHNLPRTTRLVVGCQSGPRSMKACEILLRAGYTNVVNLRGGFGGTRDRSGQVIELGWREAGLPVEMGQTPGACYADLAAKR